MTKLLYCQQCMRITPLDNQANRPVKCGCGRHSAWWSNPRTGDVRIHDSLSIRHGTHTNGIPHTPAAFFIGIHNELLFDDAVVTTKEFVEKTLMTTPDNYIFKQAGSLIIKFRPGSSGDSRWVSELPT